MRLLFAALLGLVTETAVQAAEAPARPNIVLVLCDDLGYGDLQCFGSPKIKTPNLDKFAGEGLKLTSCYASAPVCSPSRSGLLTGRTPNRAGIYDWIPDGSQMHLRKEEVTVAQILKDAGYATCHIGKWHCNGRFNSPDQPQPGDQGFDYWMSTQNNAAPSHHNPINFVRNGKAAGKMEGYSSGLIVDEALGWLHQLPADKPFCLFVWFHSPHEPIATAAEFTARYKDGTKPKEAEYYGNIAQMDAEFGRLIDTLDAMKLRDNTFVMFTSDNGPEYRAEHPFGSAGPLRGKKLHMYEGGIRVPGIVRYPGHTTAGQTSDEPINNTDFLPTFCALAGGKLPERKLDGVNFLPALEGKPLTRPVPLYWQYNAALGGPKVALREGDWKILADGALKKFELYNLKTDIAESNDLAEKEPAKLKSLQEKLLALHAEVKAEGPVWKKKSPAEQKTSLEEIVDP